MTQQELEHALQVYVRIYGLYPDPLEESSEGEVVNRAAVVWGEIQNER